jgi:hypothetical protein
MRPSAVIRIDRMEEKLDELIRLSRSRDEQLMNIVNRVEGLSTQVEEMAPTVQQVADALTFAKVGKSVFRVMMGVGIVTAPVVYWFHDKWHIVGQLFKRAS